MSPKRVYIGMLGLIAVLVIAMFASVYGISALLQTKSTSLVSSKAKLAALNDQQTELTLAKKEIKNYSGLYSIAQSVVPQSKDQAETVREIVNLAASNGVNLSSITFPSSTLGAAAAAGLYTTSTTTTSTAPIVVNPLTAGLSQLTAVSNIPGVYVLPITVQSATDTASLATYPQFIGFLKALEQNRQTAIINTIDITPNANDHSLFSFTLTMNIYIKPTK